jgi:hypothetical protein
MRRATKVYSIRNLQLHPCLHILCNILNLQQELRTLSSHQAHHHHSTNMHRKDKCHSNRRPNSNPSSNSHMANHSRCHNLGCIHHSPLTLLLLHKWHPMCRSRTTRGRQTRKTLWEPRICRSRTTSGMYRHQHLLASRILSTSRMRHLQDSSRSGRLGIIKAKTRKVHFQGSSMQDKMYRRQSHWVALTLLRLISSLNLAHKASLYRRSTIARV